MPPNGLRFLSYRRHIRSCRPWYLGELLQSVYVLPPCPNPPIGEFDDDANVGIEIRTACPPDIQQALYPTHGTEQVSSLRNIDVPDLVIDHAVCSHVGHLMKQLAFSMHAWMPTEVESPAWTKPTAFTVVLVVNG